MLVWLLTLIVGAHPWPFYQGDRSHRGYSPSYGPAQIDSVIVVEDINSTLGVTFSSRGYIYTVKIGGGTPYDTLVLVSLDTLGNMTFSYPLGPIVYSSDYLNLFPALDPESDSLLFLRYNSSIVVIKLNENQPTVLWSSPLVGTGGDGVIVVEGDRVYADGTSLTCLDKLTGTFLWSVLTQGGKGVALSPGGDTVYTARFNLYAIDAIQGFVLWALDLEFDSLISVLTVGPQGTIYLVLSGGLMAVNSDGTVKWYRTDLADKIKESVATSRQGDTLYAVYREGNSYLLAALSSEDGSPLWTQPIGEAPSPPVIDSGGVIYVGGGDTLYSFHKDGTPNWKIGGIRARFLSLGGNGILVASSDSAGFTIITGSQLNIHEWGETKVEISCPTLIKRELSLRLRRGHYRLYTIDGRLIDRFKLEEGGKYRRRLRSGIYFLKGEAKTYKLIVLN